MKKYISYKIDICEKNIFLKKKIQFWNLILHEKKKKLSKNSILKSNPALKKRRSYPMWIKKIYQQNYNICKLKKIIIIL